jgi:hypothetical protein
LCLSHTFPLGDGKCTCNLILRRFGVFASCTLLRWSYRLIHYGHIYCYGSELSTRYGKLLIPLSRGVPEELTGPQLIKKFSAFYVIRRFITCPYSEPNPSNRCPIPILWEPF